MKRLFTISGLVLLCFMFIDAAFAQSVTVKGKVTDAVTGEALVGVSISVQGTTTGTQSDVNGAYSINAPGSATLTFTYVGYATQNIAVGNRATIDVTLQAQANELQQVVVVGYGTQRKRDLTGSITSVKGEDIARQPNTNPISSLQGRVPGLTVVNSGQAGSSPTVRIRGVNSTNQTDPLYVVDGIFQTNIDYLNPADIESIEVLKDPSSIAIFGLQGGNGVIVVTTKRAAKGETRIAFQSSVGYQKVTNKIDVVDAAGFKKLYSAQLANLGAAPFDFTNYTANTNWQDLIFRDALININSLSISNSSEKTTTLINLGYNKQQGILKYDDYQKYIARVNEEIRITDNIKIGADINAFHWSQQNAGVGLNNALWAAPIVPIQVDDDTYYSMPSFQRAQVGNPIAALNQNTGNAVNKGYRAVGNIFAEVKFLKKFTWRSSFYTDLGFNNARSYSAAPYEYVNLGEGAAPTTTTRDVSTGVRPSVSQVQAEYRRFQQDHTLTYNTEINKSHRITALVGFTTVATASASISGNRRDTTLNIPRDPDFWYIGVAQQGNPGNFGGGGSQSSSMGIFGRVNYSYKEKYLLNTTYRRDGISKFSPDNRWGNFGSVGLGWVASEEDFFKDNIKALDFLKFRAAYGTVGSALGLNDNLYLPGLSVADVGVFGSNIYSSVRPDYYPDPNLHWEVVRGIDLGVDIRALRNRLSAEVTLYDRTTKDILTYITLPGVAGDRPYLTNLGNISNRGIEVALGWNDRIGKDFTYSITPNFSYNKNKVASIGDNINFLLTGNGGANRTETGNSIGYFYGYKQIGVYQSTADLDNMPHFSNSLPGDIAYEDVNKDGVLDTKDRTYLGTPFPVWNYGINVTLGYKGFDAVLQGQGVAGNKVYTQRRTSNFAVLNYESNRLNAWTGAGTSNVEPTLDNTRGNNYLFSNYFLEPGDYFRLRNVQLGYTFGSKSLSVIGLKQLRVYVSGQNIKTFAKTTGYTPEVPLSSILGAGADNGVYPQPAIYTFGINATF